MKDANWPYLAGLIDGEGYIGVTRGSYLWKGIRHPNYSLQITVTNNSLDLMQYLVEHFGGKYYIHKRTNPNANIGFTWHPKGRQNRVELLTAVLPHLVIKRKQAILGLEFLSMHKEINPEKRLALRDKSLQLNRRGVSPTTNTPECTENVQKIESELDGDIESAPDVNQGSVAYTIDYKAIARYLDLA